MTDPAESSGVILASRRDCPLVAAMLARVFHNDPTTAYIFPDPVQRARRLPRVFALLFDNDAQAGMRLLVKGVSAASLWRGPGQAHVSRAELWRDALPMLATFGTALRGALAVADTIKPICPVRGAGVCMWRAAIAIRRERGLIKAVVCAGLSRVAGRIPRYSETARDEDIGFYAASGFAVTDEWSVPRGGSRFWSMIRPPDGSAVRTSFI